MKSLEFSGKGGEYFKIWIVNILLTIVTLTLYLPWAKVRTRRYFYGNTSLDGRNFEYHATGKQMFLGHLLVIVAVAAFILLSNIYVQASGAFGLLFAVCFPWLLWKSMKFNMRMTSFSNVRFSFAGSLGGAYANTLGYPLLAMLGAALVFAVPALLVYFQIIDVESTLGMVVSGLVVLMIPFALLFLYAFVKRAKSSYLINGLRYGQGEFSTELRSSRFFWISFKAVLLFLVLSVLAVVGLYFASGLSIDEILIVLESEEAAESDNLDSKFAIFALLPVALALLATLYRSLVFTRDRQYLFRSSKLDGEVSFFSSLGARQFLWMIFTNLLLLAVTLGLAYPWVKIRITRVMINNSHVQAANGFDQYITQKEAEHSSLADQLGDAFDVDVGLAI